MTRINIDLPDELHKQVKLQALQHDQTLKEFVITVLEESTEGDDA